MHIFSKINPGTGDGETATREHIPLGTITGPTKCPLTNRHVAVCKSSARAKQAAGNFALDAAGVRIRRSSMSKNFIIPHRVASKSSAANKAASGYPARTSAAVRADEPG